MVACVTTSLYQISYGDEWNNFCTNELCETCKAKVPSWLKGQHPILGMEKIIAGIYWPISLPVIIIDRTGYFVTKLIWKFVRK